MASDPFMQPKLDIVLDSAVVRTSQTMPDEPKGRATWCHSVNLLMRVTCHVRPSFVPNMVFPFKAEVVVVRAKVQGALVIDDSFQTY